jgi:hypothetical protein
VRAKLRNRCDEGGLWAAACGKEARVRHGGGSGAGSQWRWVGVRVRRQGLRERFQDRDAAVGADKGLSISTTV